MSTIDQQFIEYIVKSLVSKPDAVVIDRRVDEKGVLLELHVDPEDLGRVIGKRGATAQSLRTLLRALGTKQDARLNLKIIDPNQADRDYEPQSSPATQEPTQTTSSASDDLPVVEDHEANLPVVETEEAPAEVSQPEPEPEDTSHSDRMDKARKELAEFDDLDV